MNDTIGFVGGGLMAEALITGIINAKLVEKKQLLVADPDQKRRDLLEGLGIQVFEQAEAMVPDCDIIVLAVKPQVMGLVLENIQPHLNDNHLLISIAAGVSLTYIENHIGDSNCRIIRVMPNTPALVQEGASAISAGKGVNHEQVTKAKKIFEAVGKAVVVAENYMDAVTGLSGSGPAYVFLFIEAMIDAGVKVGLNRDDSQTLVLQTILGSVKLAIDSKEHPAQLRAMVTSPGGTTIAGLHEMARAGFSGIIMDAVEAATLRSKELGE